MPRTLSQFHEELGATDMTSPVEDFAPEDAGAMMSEYLENPMEAHGTHEVSPQKVWPQTTPIENMSTEDEDLQGPQFDEMGSDQSEQLREMMYDMLSQRAEETEEYQSKSMKGM